MAAAFFLLSLVEAADSYPHPPLATPAAWPGVLVIVMLLGFFGTAALLGPIVRATMQEELPDLDVKDRGVLPRMRGKSSREDAKLLRAGASRNRNKE